MIAASCWVHGTTALLPCESVIRMLFPENALTLSSSDGSAHRTDEDALTYQDLTRSIPGAEAKTI
jgi:hypothetical protein